MISGKKMRHSAYTFDDVILVPKFSRLRSRTEADTSFTFWKYERSTPIISANMETITGPEMAISMWEAGGIGALHRFWTVEENVTAYLKVKEVGDCIVSIGVNKDSKERAIALYNAGARMFVVDIAHGHSIMMRETIEWLRETFGKEICIIGGNVVTAEGVTDLVDWGADYVKVGVGPGSVCTTRTVTGHGYPAFSAIYDTSGVSSKIIADGGMRSSGDIVKALAAGASCVMIGGVLSGTEETPGHVIDMGNGKKMKLYKGSSTYDRGPKIAKEGIEIEVSYKGPVESIINELTAGIRSAMSYSNAVTLKELEENAEITIQTMAGYLEGLPHMKDRK